MVGSEANADLEISGKQELQYLPTDAAGSIYGTSTRSHPWIV